jgi:signal-transduction protein with cAMP-binding, CBS, and nucleotidyltransferase domain
MSSLIQDFATFKKRLSRLPVVAHRAGEVVLTAGSKTGELLFLRSGAVEVIKDGVIIASVSAPGSFSANKPLSWTSPIRQT